MGHETIADVANRLDGRRHAALAAFASLAAAMPAQATIFSRESFAPDWVDRRWLRVIPPSLDPFSPKNEDLDADEDDPLDIAPQRRVDALGDDVVVLDDQDGLVSH